LADALQAAAFAIVFRLAPVGRSFVPVHCGQMPVFRSCASLDGSELGCSSSAGSG
jgi:hypothetical protein